MQTATGAGLPDEEDRVRLAVSGKLTDEKLAFGRQIGATDFVSGDDLPRDAGYFRFQDLVILRNRIEDAGLRTGAWSACRKNGPTRSSWGFRAATSR